MSVGKERSVAAGRVIGPFIGPRGPKSVRIVIALPDGISIQELCCRIEGPDGFVTERSSAPTSDLFRVFTFDVDNLPSDGRHKYCFQIGDQLLDLQGGLLPEDCFFRPPGDCGEDDTFVLASCHDPFQTAKGSADEGWAMWEKLFELVDAGSSIRLLILGGDQLYNDRVETGYLGKEPDSLRRAFIENYHRYWSYPAYRKVLARIPSIAIWDDHDITDGWGGRPESFSGDEFKPQWEAYFSIAKEAYVAYQASRNPQSFVGPPDEVFTFRYDWGANRFFLLDLRTQKNSKKSRVMSDTHERAFVDSLSAADEHIKSVFVLSPVVPFRCNIGVDNRLTIFSRYLFGLDWWLKKNPRFFISFSTASGVSGLWGLLALYLHDLPIFTLSEMTAAIFLLLALPKIVLMIPDLPTLTDDFEDSLTSECNRATFRRLLDRMFQVRRESGRKVVLMSGDIHACGMSEMIERDGSLVVTIPQVVSSPMAYKPMPKAVEGFTTTTSEMILDSGIERDVFARNVFYTSKRNFAQIFPSRIHNDESASILFHIEGHRIPLAMPAQFIPDKSMIR